jgi:hypothetical protein
MTSIYEKVKAKCHDDAGCMVWTGACCNKCPSIRIGNKTVLVRRVLWEEENGKIPAGHVTHMKCGTPGCVAPEHIRIMKHSTLSKELGAAGVLSGKARSAKIASTKRAKSEKITSEIAMEIRGSADPARVAAVKYGVSPSLIGKIRRNEAWADFASPFAGLGARL